MTKNFLRMTSRLVIFIFFCYFYCFSNFYIFVVISITFQILIVMIKNILRMTGRLDGLVGYSWACWVEVRGSILPCHGTSAFTVVGVKRGENSHYYDGCRLVSLQAPPFATGSGDRYSHYYDGCWLASYRRLRSQLVVRIGIENSGLKSGFTTMMVDDWRLYRRLRSQLVGGRDWNSDCF